MPTRFFAALVLFVAVASKGFGATGSLVVFDDQDESGFLSYMASCSIANTVESQIVHSGLNAISVNKYYDNNGVGWIAPMPISTNADYAGISFWINSGEKDSNLTSLTVFDNNDNPHSLHLEDIYGAKLPAGIWIPFDIPFSSPAFVLDGSTPPATIKMLCIVNHSVFPSVHVNIYLDDVVLVGADIFVGGFEN